MSNIIKTTIDPNEIRAKHPAIQILDGDVPSTATVDIFDESYDDTTKIHSFKIALDYPRRSTDLKVFRGQPVTMGGKLNFIKQSPNHLMTQEDFDAAIIRDERIKVRPAP
jgi:hypothetical protein